MMNPIKGFRLRFSRIGVVVDVLAFPGWSVPVVSCSIFLMYGYRRLCSKSHFGQMNVIMV